jgi:hypothetical protein
LHDIDTDPLSGADALKAAVMLIGSYGRRGQISLSIASFILQAYSARNAKVEEALASHRQEDLFKKYF